MTANTCLHCWSVSTPFERVAAAHVRTISFLQDSFLANNVATRVPPAKPAEGDEEEEGQANDPAEETDTDSPQAAALVAEGEAETPHE